MTRLRLALTGVLAAVAGIAVGHLVAAFAAPSASPVLAIGSTVIDLTPTPLKEWAIAHFGTNDKLVLQGSVVVVTLALAAVAGILSRTRRWVGVALISALVVLAGLAAATRPAFRPVDLLPAVATLVVGVATLLGLRWRALAASRPVADTVQSTGRPDAGPSRRGFVLASVGVAVAAGLVATAGQVRIGAQRVRSLVLPRPASPAEALPTGLDRTVPGISPLQTPTADFYRVDTNLTVPQVDVDTWTLEVDGMVENPFTLTFAELSAMPLIERDITMTCVSNEVGGGYVGAARWLGVRLTDVLGRAGLRGRPDQVLSTAVDGFTISTPLSVVQDGRDAMIAIGMNGKSLTDVHGFPARLITPGLYGFVGATKWLTKLTLTTYAQDQAYWTQRQWVTDAPIKTSARIDTPAPLSTIKAGRTAIGGVAWAQHRGVGKVEVQIDGGDWQQTRLGPDVNIDYWRQWYLPWDAKPGLHRIAVRAVDREGQVQSNERATPFPSGASGIQEVVVTVA
ncbi:DMSO/TMAO reductase YedYZ molybdopterin-dependent catalytic subunit [Terracoccus luteus]|uniref:DMSO/TMAO reductase YedYZ molybdopterin-dependent catalytic subunit n=1 Tax=Terracoccus luteus TaxID=53356 RepID=A0A495Y2Z8_9MICO|nr:molybdopterin-dependent oxidoreductase [Terracoccus luteus]RKT79744.1 DMSO/TMAO reductase YedYZ molybdopterin-dependent catalytic subunit [Terracoccus luteus]